MAETKVAKKTKKSKESIQETEVKASAPIETVADDIKVDVEIDCTTNCCSNSINQGTYIRRKRLI